MTPYYWDLAEGLIALRERQAIPHTKWLPTLARLGVEEWRWKKAKQIRELYEHRADIGKVGVNKAIKAKGAAASKRDSSRLAPPVLPKPHDPKDKRVFNPLPSIQIVHADFRELQTLAGLKDASVRLIIGDPPFDLEWLQKNGADYAATVAGLLQPHGVLALCYGKISQLLMCDYLRKHLDYRWQQIVLFVSPLGEVGGATSISGVWVDGYIPVWIFSKGSFDGRGAIHDVIQGAGKDRKRLHPHQKNVADIGKLIQSYSQKGDLVADLTGGSFTTAEACYRLGRGFVGCDIDKESVEAGLGRLAALKREVTADIVSQIEPTKFDF
jgi:hypothetical protein